MILRKPYAFLIKHFKMINLFLLALIIFSLRNVLKLSSFTKNYVSTGIYNEGFVSISNYVNTYTILALIAMILLSGVLTFLLLRKEKPILTYIYIIVVAIVTLVISLIINSYFIYTVPRTGYNPQMARLFNDIVFINTFFFYPVIVVLTIRSLGIDLNSFGFYQDNEFISSSEEDREEVEVEVKFDKYKYIRLFKNKYRIVKYFILEHLYTIIPITIGVIILAIYSSYHYIFVANRVYKQGETVSSNYYRIKVNNVYLTDKDYAGNVISSKNRYFIVIDTNITNTVNDREFDTNKLILYIDNESYVPTVRYNNSFKDLGNMFVKGNQIKRGTTENYMFIYEIDKPKEDSNFLLKYQDTLSKDKKLIRIKLKVQDISSFKERDTKVLGEEIEIPVNKELKYTFTLNNLSITDEKSYTYESCNGNYNCPIIESTVTASTNKKIVYFKLNTDVTTQEYLNFITKYGKIRYKVGEEEYTEKIKTKISKYRGSHVYLETSNKIENAEKITLVFTIRTNQYFYVLRGDK